MNAPEPIDPDEELWSMKTVSQKTGRSKSDIYRQISEGGFPRSRPYLDSLGKPTPRVFWRSTEVRAWIAAQISGVPQRPAQPASASPFQGMIG